MTTPWRPTEQAAMLIAGAARRDLDEMRAKVRAILALPWLHDELQFIIGALLVLQRHSMNGSAPHLSEGSWLRLIVSNMNGASVPDVWANMLTLEASKDADVRALAAVQHSSTRNLSTRELADIIGTLAENLHRDCHPDRWGRSVAGIARVRQVYGVPARRGMRVSFDGRLGLITGARRGTMQLFVRFDDTWWRSDLTHPSRLTYGQDATGAQLDPAEVGGWGGDEAAG